jgi:hypothetical protein
MRPDDRPRRWRSIHAKVCLAAIVIAVLGAACTSLLAIKDPTLDDAGGGGPSEAGAIDAAVDSAIDSSIDAGVDSSIDAPIDAPPVPCTSGVCCNSTTGVFEPTTKVCGTTTEFQCSPSASSCGGQPQSRTNQQFCSGDASTCTGRTMAGTFANLGAACGAGKLCVPQSGGAAPQCSTCAFGCDTGATVCRLPIFVFVTDSARDAAFGLGVAGGARAAGDARCQNMYNANFMTTRSCTQANIHAVLQADDALDTIERMKITFPTIPLTSGVFRATADTTQVADNWDAFVNDPLLSEVKPGTRVPFWSGRSSSGGVNCTNWTSNSSGQGAVGGDASKKGGWMTLLGLPCSDIDEHLLCACW